ncbi:MAG TPA: MBL fold metallo-hydrolase [Saprospiraceae bacterium]|nr:MBL fold metallo-hydrolase [Saprospiraceae bacterium]
MNVQSFVFNDFYENTYIIFDETGECVIIDPGCNTSVERRKVVTFIDQHNLKPVMLINTHCHIDHVLGNKFISETYSLGLFAHEIEKQVLAMQPNVAMYYGIDYDPSPQITGVLADNDVLTFGNTRLKILFVPGHSPGHICIYHQESNQLVAGDALFKESIGRTDLPGGDYDTLISSISTQLFTLPDETIVYSGHGENTSIGHERKNNPFFRV